MPEKFFYRSKVRRLIDIVASPLAWAGALFFRYYRRDNGRSMPFTKKILLGRGIYPVADHYEEPMFNTKKHLRYPLSEDRQLPGIDLNPEEQLSILERFHYQEELLEIPLERTGKNKYHYYNGVFESGDAEYWYCMIRTFKPKKIIEIGSGYSTLLAQHAIAKNKTEDPGYFCEHVCIEPYEAPWLEETGASVIRQKAEIVNPEIFRRLEANDMLFIDSSHIIRPQGEVLFIFLELLPQLEKGVWVHVHDIFTPRDYPRRWIEEENRFWNEQYLLEGFLSLNRDFRITGALNYLAHHHPEQLFARCPVLAKEKKQEPGSFWMIKN